jgi:hypothetical protein
MPATNGALNDFLRVSLRSELAHPALEAVVDGLQWNRTGHVFPGLPHTAFSIVWHMGLYMRLLISRAESDEHREPAYSTRFWPAHASPLAESEWTLVVEEALRAEATLHQWIETRNLSAAIRGVGSHSLFSELVVTERHNAYHIGQLVTYRRLAGLP